MKVVCNKANTSQCPHEKVTYERDGVSHTFMCVHATPHKYIETECGDGDCVIDEKTSIPAMCVEVQKRKSKQSHENSRTESKRNNTHGDTT